MPGMTYISQLHDSNCAPMLHCPVCPADPLCQGPGLEGTQGPLQPEARAVSVPARDTHPSHPAKPVGAGEPGSMCIIVSGHVSECNGMGQLFDILEPIPFLVF
ncbi:protein chibby-like protein 1 [Platysternon megacephalum]|uniref:Protein chibby-like protein 1 n=1 Tax=Platysternon megacephalum TaxID=55544 RepID=A0A4D9EJA1_9SAUR|nr:protein chibby-like protein 1 [Platysternon megacephalum]